jgi:hypothetical protein
MESSSLGSHGTLRIEQRARIIFGTITVYGKGKRMKTEKGGRTV